MTHALAAALAAFLASFVEFLEALTVVLAVGATRGWRNALTGATVAAAALAGLIGLLGPRAALPAAPLRLAVGVLTLMFGLRWLRKAVLRAAGLLPLHDEAATYEATRASFGTRRDGWDGTALATAFQVVVIEGLEVVLIVAAVGAGGGALAPATVGAGAALLSVVALGVLLHRPITQIPENLLKGAVGAMLCGFGTFWAGESLGAAWPGGEWALPALGFCWAIASLIMIRIVAV